MTKFWKPSTALSRELEKLMKDAVRRGMEEAQGKPTMNRQGGTMYGVPEPTIVYGAPDTIPFSPSPPVIPSPPWPPCEMLDDRKKLLEELRQLRIGPMIPPTELVARLHPDDRALLEAINAKLDVLLERTAPEAELVTEIRRRVNEALDGVQKKTT